MEAGTTYHADTRAIRWTREHPGAEVPREIESFVRDGLLVDCSWHNDIAPWFGGMLRTAVPNAEDRYDHEPDSWDSFALWVDYRRAEDRELPESRRFDVYLAKRHDPLDFEMHTEPEGHVLSTNHLHEVTAWLHAHADGFPKPPEGGPRTPRSSDCAHGWSDPRICPDCSDRCTLLRRGAREVKPVEEWRTPQDLTDEPSCGRCCGPFGDPRWRDLYEIGLCYSCAVETIKETSPEEHGVTTLTPHLAIPDTLLRGLRAVAADFICEGVHEVIRNNDEWSLQDFIDDPSLIGDHEISYHISTDLLDDLHPFSEDHDTPKEEIRANEDAWDAMQDAIINPAVDACVKHAFDASLATKEAAR